MWDGARRKIRRGLRIHLLKDRAQVGPSGGGGRDGRTDRSAYTTATIVPPALSPPGARILANSASPLGSGRGGLLPSVSCPTELSSPRFLPAARSAPSQRVGERRLLSRTPASVGATPPPFPSPRLHAAFPRLRRPPRHARVVLSAILPSHLPRHLPCCLVPSPGCSPARHTVCVLHAPARPSSHSSLIPSPPLTNRPAPTCQTLCVPVPAP